MIQTTTDVGASKWLLNDDPYRFREWCVLHGNEYKLPENRAESLLIGRLPKCDIVLDDPLVSREHARVYYREGRWWMRTLEAKNGLIVDGVSLQRTLDETRKRNTRDEVDEIALVPGMLIEVGGATWIVESLRLGTLRSYLSRLIGHTSDKFAEVDRALRSVRRAAMGQDPLAISGEGDLVQIARSLHRRILGANRPFIVCNRVRARSRATVRSGENYPSALQALAAARGGTLCLASDRLPADHELILAAHREPNARFVLVITEKQRSKRRLDKLEPLVVPPLSTRRDELASIIKAYADDARMRLGAEEALHERDSAWIERNVEHSHADLETGTERVVAFRSSQTMLQAATKLGMTSSSLGRWFDERKPLPDRDGATTRRPR